MALIVQEQQFMCAVLLSQSGEPLQERYDWKLLIFSASIWESRDYQGSTRVWLPRLYG